MRSVCAVLVGWANGALSSLVALDNEVKIKVNIWLIDLGQDSHVVLVNVRSEDERLDVEVWLLQVEESVNWFVSCLVSDDGV